MTTTTTLHPVDEFARAVRAALADLPAEEVDDLTDGLEADLTERAADEESPEFGDPVAYANELRSAAGLPPRKLYRPKTLEGALAGAWQEFASGLRDVYSRPLITKVGQFFVALRPVWWLIRAWAFYGVLCWLLSGASLQLTPLTFVLAVVALVVSVQFGRGKWLPRNWMRKSLLGVNVVLVLAMPIVLMVTGSAWGSQIDAAYAQGANDGSHQQNGLVYNGRGVANIFAYDASGKPLTQVQLYDQAGRPLYTVSDPAILMTDSPFLVPYAGKHGRGGWNVYPLGFITDNQRGLDGNPKRNAKSSPSTLNGLLVPPLKKETPKPTPTPTPTPTATPTPAPTN